MLNLLYIWKTIKNVSKDPFSGEDVKFGEKNNVWGDMKIFERHLKS